MKLRAVLVVLALLAPATASARPGQRARSVARQPQSTPVSERSAKADKPDRGAAASADKGEGKQEGKNAGTTDATPAGGTSTSTTSAGGKTIKTKTYTFGAMDVEGKLKTPQLLYFLNRVKLELDMSAPDKRSFMKELAKSADDKSL
jgi:hypothetical protein